MCAWVIVELPRFGGCEPAGHVDRQALPGVFTDDRQQTKRSAVVWVRSCMKSYAQTWSFLSGRSRMHDPSLWSCLELVEDLELGVEDIHDAKNKTVSSGVPATDH